MRGILSIVCLLVSAWPALASAAGSDAPLKVGDTVTGAAVVLDGDTYLIDGVRWREKGIDAPEMRGDSRGPRARAALDDMVAGRPVTCLYLGRDGHKRNLGRCVAADGQPLGLGMVRRGWAFVHRLYVEPEQADAYNAAEAEARAVGRGFWSMDSMNTKTSWSDILQKITPLLAVLAVVLAGFGAWFIRRWERRKERQALEAAFFAEIVAIISITDLRGHVESSKTYIERLNAGENLNMPRIVDMDIPSADIIKNYPVFNANVGRIGMLGPETAADVVKFYTQCMGIITTLRGWALGQWDNETPEQKAESIATELALWKDTRDLGFHICGQNLTIPQ